MDEIDAIGGRRFSEGTSADREIQRTLMELLNQLDGFDQLGKVLIELTLAAVYLIILLALLGVLNFMVYLKYVVMVYFYAIGKNDHGYK